MKKPKILYLLLLGMLVIAEALYAKDISSFDKEAFIKSAKDEKIIELSLNECIMFSLINNSELKLKRIEPIIAENNIKKAKGIYEPLLKTYYEYDETNKPGAMPTLTGKTEDKSRMNDYNIGVEGKLFTNTKYDINWDNNTYSSNSRLQRFFPNYESTLSGTITQPVLKDFLGMGIDQANIVIAKNNKEISDCNFEEEVINVITSVKSTYYDYVYHIGQYKVGEISLQSAQDLKKIVQQRYEKGLASSVELLEAEAGVAKREERLLFYERLLKKTEDELKLITNLIDDPELWNAQIHAKDRPTFEIRKIDLAESIKEAFGSRPDYNTAKIDLKNKDINIKVAKNNLWPTVDLVGTYAANGLGDKYESAIDQIQDGTYGSWSLGVNVKIPFGFSKETADYRISKLEKEKAIIAFSRLEQKIILETRDAARSVDIAYRSVEATEKTLGAEGKKYQAAKERFRTGLISMHDMLQYQEDFDSANLNYLQAVIDYNNAVINLEKTKGTTLAENNIIIE